jgi:hypothetical protein
VSNQNRLGTPVDIPKLQMHNLAGAQAIGRQQREDRIVTSTTRLSITPRNLQNLLDLVGPQNRRDRLELVQRGPDHPPREIEWHVPALMKETKEPAQLLRYRLQCRTAHLCGA